MSIFKTLAETIYDKKFYNIEEMEDVIETYFKIYLSDAKGAQLMDDAIAIERQRIMSEQSQLGIKRTVIEKQIFDAKANIAEGKGIEVDRYWLSRANMAFRMTKQAIVECQNRLANLVAVQKSRNIERSNTEDRQQLNALKIILEGRFGKDYVIEILNEADTKR